MGGPLFKRTVLHFQNVSRVRGPPCRLALLGQLADDDLMMMMMRAMRPIMRGTATGFI